MKKDEFLAEIAVLLNEDPKNVRPEVEMEELASWDSAGLLGIATLLDEIGVKWDPDVLWECKTFQDLISVAGDKLE